MSDNLYIGTTNGVFTARRESEGWHKVEGSLSAHFVTSVAACEGFILVGTKDGIWRSVDGGRNWNLASKGLDLPWPQHMVERFCQSNEELIAVLSNGELWSTELEAIEWHHILPDIEGITSIAVSR